MAQPTLDSLTADLNAQTVGLLGDPITYKVGSAAAVPIRAFVDHTDKTDAFGGVQMTAQDMIIEVFKTDVPVVAASDVIYLPAKAKSYNPKEWKNNPSATGYFILLKTVRS